jgi:hypothetical protein
MLDIQAVNHIGITHVALAVSSLDACQSSAGADDSGYPDHP